MSIQDLNSAVSRARALGHPARLRTVAMLRSGELCVCQINAVLELAPSTVSAHLKELKQAGLTIERKDGRWVVVGLSEDPTILGWLEASLSSLNDDPQLASDARLIEDLRKLPVEDLCRLGYEAAKAKTCRSDEE